MYGPGAWGGNVDPFILVKFQQAEKGQEDTHVSLIMYEWRDQPLLGMPNPENDEEVGCVAWRRLLGTKGY
jgi:hypothetical protein